MLFLEKRAESKLFKLLNYFLIHFSKINIQFINNWKY